MPEANANTRTQPVSFGFVDTFEKGHFSGWCYTNTRLQQQILLKVNGQPIRTINANMYRDDVKSIGVPVAKCGFDLSIDLKDLPTDGCDISFHEPVFGEPLENGIFHCHAGTIARGSEGGQKTSLLGIQSYVKLFQSTDSAMTIMSFIELALKKLSTAPDSIFAAMSYLLILGRTPDPDGFHNSLQTDLSSNANRHAFLLNMVSSVEFTNKRSVAAAMIDLNKLKA